MTSNKKAELLRGKYFPVLDHGFVALIDYMGGDTDIVQAARVSYGAGTKSVNEDRGLIRYLMRHRHTTPFEQVELKFHVKLPIFVARQLIRHRTASVNEYSMRYSLPALQFYSPLEDQVRAQSTRNKQGREGELDPRVVEQFLLAGNVVKSYAETEYTNAAQNGVARELARINLPVSTYTEWYWKIDLHNLFHFLGLRCDSHAQWEIRQYAQIKAAMANAVAPLAFEAWLDYSFLGERFSRHEMAMLKLMLEGNETERLSYMHQFVSSSETTEFKEKLARSRDVPDWAILDPSRGLSAEHFRAAAEATVPKVDRK